MSQTGHLRRCHQYRCRCLGRTDTAGLAWPRAGQLRKHRLQLWKRRKNNLDSGMPVRYLGSNIFMIEREISVDIFPSQLSRKYKCPQLFLYRKAYNLSGHCPEIGKYTNLALCNLFTYPWQYDNQQQSTKIWREQKVFNRFIQNFESHISAMCKVLHFGILYMGSNW